MTFAEALDVLGIELPCSTKEAARAFRKRAMDTHPDRHPEVDPMEFRRVVEALKVATLGLSDAMVGDGEVEIDRESGIISWRAIARRQMTQRPVEHGVEVTVALTPKQSAEIDAEGFGVVLAEGAKAFMRANPRRKKALPKPRASSGGLSPPDSPAMEQFTAAMGFGGALSGDDFVDRGRREIAFVTTSDHPHSNGNVVISDGIDWRSYATNPLLLLGHEGGERDWRALPIGKWVARKSTDSPDGMPGVMCRARFCNEEQVSKGSDAWHLSDSVYRMSLPENGIVNQTSISWTAHDAMAPKAIRHQSGLTGKYFQRSNMIEQSVVLIPANTNARRVDAGPEALIKQAASAAVITGDEATLIGRYVGVVRPYEVAGLGATERLSGVDMPSVGGWVPFQAERLVSASDGTLRSVAAVEPTARAVASVAADAGEEPRTERSSPPPQASDAAPAVRSRLAAARIHFDRERFPTRESAALWLREHAFDANPAELNEMRSAWGFHPKVGPFVGEPVEESLDTGVTALLRVLDPRPPARAQASAPARDGVTLERFLATSAKAADRAAIVRAAAAVKSLSRTLFIETGEDSSELHRNLETAALLSRDVSDSLSRLVAAVPPEFLKNQKKKKGEEEPDDEEQYDEDGNPIPPDEEEDTTDEEADTEDKKPAFLKKKKKKTPETAAAVHDLERAARRVGELLTIARRSRQTASAEEVQSDAPPVEADPKAAALKAAHDRLQAFFATRRAPKAPDTSQGGDEAGAADNRASGEGTP